MALQQLIIRRKSSAIQLSHAPLTTLDRGNLHVIDYKSTKTHPWDIAHDAVNIRSDISFAEPDLDCSEFIYRRAIFHNNIKTVEEYKSYLPEWKSPDEKGVWHLKDKYTGLKSARDAVNTGKIKRTVRIAHLDTGYLPNHLSSPNELIEKNLEKNFAVGGTPDSAVDPCLNAFWQMPGHGTATLAILAGKKMDMSYCNFNDYIGIYGNIKIVPIRICPSVILLKSSGFVKAMSYILEELAQQGGIDIVTMSMGGLPAASWADLVNTAYDKGIFLVSAAGNNFNKLPTHSTIYPARFRRVVAVCGATYDFSPWVKPAGQGSFSIMEGNYGPRELMDKAIASFSPNITWAAWPYNDVMGICSNGTSSATPQIAAAAALYILKYSEDLDKLSAPWMKVQAIRHALFSSASHQISGDGSSYETYYGNGILNANAMLGIKIPEERDLQIEPQDKVRFPLLKMILNIPLVPDSDREEMLETELMQIAMQDPKIMEMVDTEDAANFTQSDYEMIRNRILNSGLASNTLASAIKN